MAYLVEIGRNIAIKLDISVDETLLYRFMEERKKTELKMLENSNQTSPETNRDSNQNGGTTF